MFMQVRDLPLALLRRMPIPELPATAGNSGGNGGDLPATAGNLEEFCRRVFGRSYNKMLEEQQNFMALGEESYEAASRLGLNRSALSAARAEQGTGEKLGPGRARLRPHPPPQQTRQHRRAAGDAGGPQDAVQALCPAGCDAQGAAVISPPGGGLGFKFLNRWVLGLVAVATKNRRHGDDRDIRISFKSTTYVISCAAHPSPRRPTCAAYVVPVFKGLNLRPAEITSEALEGKVERISAVRRRGPLSPTPPTASA